MEGNKSSIYVQIFNKIYKYSSCINGIRGKKASGFTISNNKLNQFLFSSSNQVYQSTIRAVYKKEISEDFYFLKTHYYSKKVDLELCKKAINLL